MSCYDFGKAKKHLFVFTIRNKGVYKYGVSRSERKELQKKILRMTASGYTVSSFIFAIVIIGVLSSIIVPKISLFKAKGQQSESRVKLIRIYHALYAFKTKQGKFPETGGKVIPLDQLHALEPYLLDRKISFSLKKDKIFILAQKNKFAVAYVREVSPEKWDIQRINSQKIICHMLNSIENIPENCEKSQIYKKSFRLKEVQKLKKLALLKND
jgi:hypothetical protein